MLFAIVAGPVAAVAQPSAAASAASPLSVVRDQLGSFRRPVYQGPPFSLESALDEALKRNPTLLALRAQFEAARQRPAQERFLAAPTFEAQIWQWPINTLNPVNSNMYMFMVGQDLPGRGKRAARALVVEKEVAIAEADIAVQAREVIDRVKRTYAELFLSRMAITVNHDNLDLLRQLADITSVKYTTGRISQQDVLKAVVELSRLHDALLVLEQQAALAEAQLNTLLDRAPEAPIGPLAEPVERVLLPPSSVLQRLALEQQPELRTARLGVERSEAALALANREYKPDFFVVGGYMLMPRDTDAWTVTVGITWPNAPWARGRLDARKAEATADIAAAQARRRAAENAVRLAVQDAYVRVKVAEQRAALLRTTVVPQSRQTLDVSRAAYQTDRVEFLALLDNQRVLLDAQLEYYRALSDLEQALADLERAVGVDIGRDMLGVINIREVK
ncbi:MAG: TolC family protein [Gemmatimonadaceae bacterium]|nr:TolC family protein [Gemmatimonadaceae bacterium]